MKSELMICYLVDYKLNGKVERTHVAALDIPESIKLLTSYLSKDDVFEVLSVSKLHSILV